MKFKSLAIESYIGDHKRCARANKSAIIDDFMHDASSIASPSP